MLRISEIDGVIRVNGEVLEGAAFEAIFSEALGTHAFAATCEELKARGVSYVDLSPNVRGAPLTERLSRAEAEAAIQAIADSYMTVAEAVEKLVEAMGALTARYR